MGPRSRGQSETIGVILLIGVVVTLVFLVGFVVFGDFQSQVSDDQRANIDSTTTVDNVTLDHRGGDSMDAADVTVIVSGTDEESGALEDGTLERGTDSGRFDPGDRWTWDHSVSGDTLRLVVVHDPTNTILHEDTTVVG